MDYLLRDSHHAGVAYGAFDRYRLVDTLRILPREDLDSAEPMLGLEEGGLQSAEALMLARYFMYRQVYIHSIRRIYDIFLKEFLKKWLPGSYFPIDIDGHLKISDVEVLTAIHAAARDPGHPGHETASNIVNRNHFKVLYERNPTDQTINREAAKAVYEAACSEYGAPSVRYDEFTQAGGAPDFPVQTRDGRIVSSLMLSEALNHIPVVNVDYVFVERSKFTTALRWLDRNRNAIIGRTGEVAG